MSERVWTVPAQMVAETAGGREFWRWESGSGDRWLERLGREGAFVAREVAESDETRRQVIPYTLLRAPSGGYFTYRRLPAGSEERLVDRYSIGVGGHLNDDGLLGVMPAVEGLRPSLIAHGLHRELAEELILPDGGVAIGTARPYGFLALDATPVDRVHVGVVIIVDVKAEIVARCDVRERDKLRAVGWHTPESLTSMLTQVEFEGWSRTLVAAGLP